jgi:hypothetical protein
MKKKLAFAVALFALATVFAARVYAYEKPKCTPPSVLECYFGGDGGPYLCMCVGTAVK